MAVQPKKASRSQTSRRHSMWANKLAKNLTHMVNLVSCDNCGESKKGHEVCHKCGYYKGRQILSPKKSGGTVVHKESV